MKYKISLLFFLLLFVAYVLLSFLNSDKVPFDVGFGKLETTVTNYVAAAFVLGVIFSIIASFFTDARRGLAKWRSERKERRRNEAYELFEKAKLYEMKGEPEKAEEYFNRVIRSVPDMEEPYLLLADMHAARGEPGKAVEALDLGERRLGKKESILLKKAKIHHAQNDLDAVERDLLDVVRITGSSLEALGALRDLYIGRKAWAQALEMEERVRKQVKTREEDQRFLGSSTRARRSAT